MIRSAIWRLVMRRLLIFASFLIAGTVTSQEVKDFGKERLNNSPRHGEWVDIKSGERTLKAFVVYPERKEKAPVVIVIHEIFGLTDWARMMCDELAEAGVIAIAPDLLSGQKYEDVDGARKAISALTTDQVKADLDATFEYALTKIPAANGNLGVCGFCWGGGWAFGYAAMNPKLKASYSFYGVAIDNAADAAKVPCPVYGFYAENDERVNATISKAEQSMKAAEKNMSPLPTKVRDTVSCVPESPPIRTFGKATRMLAKKRGRGGKSCWPNCGSGD